MKPKLLFSFLLLILSLQDLYSQESSFEIQPYMDGLTSIKDGNLEAGAVFKWRLNKTVLIAGIPNKTPDNKLIRLKTTMRLPLTNKSQNIVQVDRFTSTWKLITALQYTLDNSKSVGRIEKNSFSLQGEFGFDDFEYHPTGITADGIKENKSSYSAELKYVGIYSTAGAGKYQWSPQFRIRYSYDWKGADAVNVINLPDENGVTTITNMVITAPSAKAMFSPAFSLQIYPGAGNFSYSPTVYYDFTGKANESSPFNNLSRMRIECWLFYYPVNADKANLKIGISPFVSIRTMGIDNLNRCEFGGMLTVKFDTTFLQFL